MTLVDEFLEHHGVKGMKWGIRNKKKSTSNSQKSSTSTGPKKPHELSDSELQKAIARMELEQKFTNLSSKKKSKAAGAAFASDLGKTLVKIAVTTAGTHAVNQALKKVSK